MRSTYACVWPIDRNITQLVSIWYLAVRVNTKEACMMYKVALL